MSYMETERANGTYQPKRQSVTLTARDLADLAMLRESSEAQRVVGASGDMSESALLHTLVAHSLKQAREAADDAAYAALAADPEERQIEAALRRRGRRFGAEAAE